MIGDNVGNKIPDLRGLAGEGVVEEHFYKTLEAKKAGRIKFIEDYPIIGKKACQGIQLWVELEFEEAIATCDGEEYFICENANRCDPTSSKVVRVEGNRLQQLYDSSFSEERNHLALSRYIPWWPNYSPSN